MVIDVAIYWKKGRSHQPPPFSYRRRRGVASPNFLLSAYDKTRYLLYRAN
jgi:hypothetical protein